MSLIYGSGLLFAALMLLCVGRAVFARLDSDGGEPRFGPTEALGLAITILFVIAIALDLRVIAADPGAATIGMVAGSVLAALLVAVVAWRFASRLGGSGDSASALPPGRPIQRGSSGPGGPGHTAEGARRKKRAA